MFMIILPITRVILVEVLQKVRQRYVFMPTATIIIIIIKVIIYDHLLHAIVSLSGVTMPRHTGSLRCDVVAKMSATPIAFLFLLSSLALSTGTSSTAARAVRSELTEFPIRCYLYEFISPDTAARIHSASAT